MISVRGDYLVLEVSVGSSGMGLQACAWKRGI